MRLTKTNKTLYVFTNEKGIEQSTTFKYFINKLTETALHKQSGYTYTGI